MFSGNSITLRRIVCLAIVHLLLAQVPGLAAEPRTPITRVADIRRLTREEAAMALPVRFTGVVVWSGMGAIVCDDGEKSIWVDVNQGLKHGLPGVAEQDRQPGCLLEIEGVTDPGGYAPIVIPGAIRLIGNRPLRDPARVSVDRLLSGAEDGQYVEIEGVFQELDSATQGADSLMLSLSTDGHFCRVFVVHGSGLKESEIVDSRARVRGVLAPDHNSRSEVVNLKLLVNSAADFKILSPPTADPFESPRVPLNRLAPFSPDARPWHRKVTSGTILLAVPGQYFFLQDGGTSVRVNSDATGLKPGQRVDVAGFVERFDSIASMKNALVRTLGEAPLPDPLPVTPAKLLDSSAISHRLSAAAIDYACRMVCLTGRIQRLEWTKPGFPRAIWVQSDGTLFPAYLPLNQMLTSEQARTWVPGARINLTGICELKFSGLDTLKRSYTPVAFHILMSGPFSVQILELPPWWTVERMRNALAAVGVTALLLLAWAWLLRRQVARQSLIIGEKIGTEAVHNERSRIARDLHDAIEQQLAGVSLHLYGAETAISSDPRSAVGALGLARRMLKHTQRETRNSIRQLRSPLLEGRGLAGALHILAEEASSSVGPKVEAHVVGESPHILPDTQYQLLRLAQEALGNALKHANAKLVSIHMEFAASQVLLSVTDDGCGFTPELTDFSDTSHFGLRGMRERASKIGAVLEITSSPGAGTTIHISLPLPKPSNP